MNQLSFGDLIQAANAVENMPLVERRDLLLAAASTLLQLKEDFREMGAPPFDAIAELHCELTAIAQNIFTTDDSSVSSAFLKAAEIIMNMRAALD
ncbi:MAG: hypothetical protein J0H18_13315 [Rhizobiales bacterium]|nr:hypothetical protein [Hyphomicrobiales bacterium]OJY04864.1 MAG: hypothetical protein BGP07_09210 [Rhizobiales bacterium 63-22]